MWSSRSRAQRKKKEETEAAKKAKTEEETAARPWWVVDHNTFLLWERGIEEADLPQDLTASSMAASQVVVGVRDWAARQVAELEKELEKEKQPLPAPLCMQHREQRPVPPPPPPPQPNEPRWGVGSLLCPEPMSFDAATLAKAAALAAGPRLGVSPTMQ